MERYAAISSGDNGQVESQKPLLRSNSVSSAVPLPTRKRTSSGVFKVDDVSSLLKEFDNKKGTKTETEKLETQRKEKTEKIKKIDKTKKLEKIKKIEKNETDKKIEKKLKLVGKIAKIESTKNVKCVTAFKESDSWD